MIILRFLACKDFHLYFRNMKFVIFLPVLIFVAETNFCQCQSHYGTEFYFGIPHNIGNECEDVYVTIATQTAGTYNLTVPFLNVAKTGTIQTNLSEIKLDCSISKLGTFKGSRGVYLKTSMDVAVYATNYYIHSVETFLVIPVPETGKQYSTVAYQPFDSNETSFVLISATNPETIGSIYDSDNNRVIQNFSLNPIEVFQYSSSDDLKGITVIANKQIAVITGTTCVTIPHGVSACDMIAEQMIPTESWDKIYIAPPTPPKEGYELRVTKFNRSAPGKICFYNRTTQSYCGNDATISIRLGNTPTVIVSESPVAVVQFGFGYSYPQAYVGDPFMSIIPGLGNFLNNYFFAIPNVYTHAQNHISIIIPILYIKGLVLDGSNVSSSPHSVLDVFKPLSNYTVLILNISSGYHHLYHKNIDVKFGLLVYGFGKTIDTIQGYGYPGGMKLSEDDSSITLPTSVSVTSVPDSSMTDSDLNATIAADNSSSAATQSVTSAWNTSEHTNTFVGNTTSPPLQTTSQSSVLSTDHQNTSQSTTFSEPIGSVLDVNGTDSFHGNSTSLQERKNNSPESPLGIIIGAVCGAIAAISLVACLLFFIARKKMKSVVQPETTKTSDTSISMEEDVNGKYQNDENQETSEMKEI